MSKTYDTIIKFAKVRPDAQIPSKRDEDVAYDLYSCFEENNLIIPPHTSKLIPTGIASCFDKEYGLIFYERGSTGVKNLKVNAGVIDSGFRNEIFVCLFNMNDKPVVITKEEDIEALQDDYVVYPYKKAIAQCLLVPVPKAKIEEITYDELKNITSKRGTGKLGSSNK